MWYFTPYYAILRAVPDQKMGALLMALSVAAFLFLPWLDRAKNKSIRYRGVASKILLGTFFVTFLMLMWLGLKPAEGIYVLLARIFTVAVLRVLHPAAVRVQGRRQRSGSRSSDLPCPLSLHASLRRLALLLGAGAVSANEGGHAGWQRAADNEIANLPSLQRGARNFMDYCSGCHSLKYMRYSRLAEDLKISDHAARQIPGEAGRQVLRLHQGVDARRRRAGMVRQGRRRICRWSRARAAPTGCSTS